MVTVSPAPNEDNLRRVRNAADSGQVWMTSAVSESEKTPRQAARMLGSNQVARNVVPTGTMSGAVQTKGGENVAVRHANASRFWQTPSSCYQNWSLEWVPRGEAGMYIPPPNAS